MTKSDLTEEQIDQLLIPAFRRLEEYDSICRALGLTRSEDICYASACLGELKRFILGPTDQKK